LSRYDPKDTKPVAPESIDPDQYKALKKFKAKCEELGIIEHFEDLIDLKDKFTRQLQLCLNKNEYLQGILTKATGPVAPNSVLEPEPQQTSYRLSDEAQILLKSAASRDDGTILKISMLGGRLIRAGVTTFGTGGGRESAKWEHALNELLNERLVVERGYKGEVFELTHEGWNLADQIK
jgi:hypothetical protein